MQLFEDGTWQSPYVYRGAVYALLNRTVGI